MPAPVYAPALVAFLGGSGFDLSVSVGGGNVGWFPLGPGEVFVPPYRVSQTYIRNINVTAVKVRDIDFSHLDQARMRFANRGVSGAITTVPRETFLRSQPVARAAIRMPASSLSRATVIGAPRSMARPPLHAIATPSHPAEPVLQRAWQVEREQAVTRQAAERAALERRQQEQLRRPPSGVSQEELRRRQIEEQQAMARRHQAETDDIDRRYRRQHA